MTQRFLLAIALASTLSSACSKKASEPDGGYPESEVPPTTGEDFLVNELLGRPTESSVSVSVVPSREVELYFEAGLSRDAWSIQTEVATAAAKAPVVGVIKGLSPDTAYVYRVRWRRTGTETFSEGPVRKFHTQRPDESTFRFTIQSDSHLDENSVLELYQRTLANVAADEPDFHIDLGDTFMCEKHSEPFSGTSPPASDEATVLTRYLFERGQFGRIAHSVPLFLVNGNHEGEQGLLFAGSGNDVATWATRARLSYFLNPVPDAFFSGDLRQEPIVGQRAAFYSWTWGDALFVALDPYWDTKQKAGRDPWLMTLGETQYRWLVETLTSSAAKYKFVFLHNLVGGLDGQMRGGIEAAPYYEWGGHNDDLSQGFDAKRPGWGRPIHQVLVDTKVTAVFHGHDHLYAHQLLDGVIYQEVPQPSARNSQNGEQLAATYHYTSGAIDSSAGHMRITVSPEGVTGEYVRAWLPANETGSRKNGEISQTWTVTSR